MSTYRHPIEQEELMAYLDGELPADQAAEALSHLEFCPECEALVADFRGISQELLAWEVDSAEFGVSSDLDAALGEYVRKRQEANVGSPKLKKKARRRPACART